MYVDFHIRDEAAKQLREAIETHLPITPPGWSEEDLGTLRAVLNEIVWPDLMNAVQAAADRLSQPEDEADLVGAEERSDDKSDLGGTA
jgi:hypothetical protein